MSWNYRVVRSNNILSIREVYYDDDGTPQGMTESPLAIEAYLDEGESIETILYILDRIKESVEKYGILDDPWPENEKEI